MQVRHAALSAAAEAAKEEYSFLSDLDPDDPSLPAVKDKCKAAFAARSAFCERMVAEGDEISEELLRAANVLPVPPEQAPEQPFAQPAATADSSGDESDSSDGTSEVEGKKKGEVKQKGEGKEKEEEEEEEGKKGSGMEAPEGPPEVLPASLPLIEMGKVREGANFEEDDGWVAVVTVFALSVAIRWFGQYKNLPERGAGVALLRAMLVNEIFDGTIVQDTAVARKLATAVQQTQVIAKTAGAKHIDPRWCMESWGEQVRLAKKAVTENQVAAFRAAEEATAASSSNARVAKRVNKALTQEREKLAVKEGVEEAKKTAAGEERAKKTAAQEGGKNGKKKSDKKRKAGDSEVGEGGKEKEGYGPAYRPRVRGFVGGELCSYPNHPRPEHPEGNHWCTRCKARVCSLCVTDNVTKHPEGEGHYICHLYPECAG